MKRLAALLIFLGLLSGQAHGACSAGSLPFNLTNGTLADASQVMANYSAIISSVNATCAGSGANSDITSLLGLTTALTAAQGGTNTWVATVASGGSANAQTVTTSLPTTSFTLTKGFSVTFLPGFTNTGALTLAVNGTTATAVCMRVVASGACNALVGGEINTGIWTTVTYDGTSYELTSMQLQPGFGMQTYTSGSQLGISTTNTPVQTGVINGSFTATVSGNNLTVTLTTQNGGVPSTTNPVLVGFQNGSGITWVAITSAITFTANSGSSFGSSNATATRYWVMLINNGGTVQIGLFQAVQTAAGTLIATAPATNEEFITTAACNACNNATLARTAYSTTALSNKAFKYLGYFEATEATAGVWATAPSIINLFGPNMHKPGDMFNPQFQGATSANSSISSVATTAAPNLLLVQGFCQGTDNTAAVTISCTVSGSVSGNLYIASGTQYVANEAVPVPTGLVLFRPGNTSQTISTTAAASGGSLTINQTTITIWEVMGALEPANDNGPLRLAG